jgi:shikimate dehydrogenase
MTSGALVHGVPVYGVMGWPVAHSRSPAMHNAALRALGLPGVYVPIAVLPDRLSRAVSAAHLLGVSGFNLTLPHKSAIIPLLASVEASARAIGAVNTVVRDGNDWIGANTDAAGLVHSLREAGVEPRGRAAVVLGAGGAARAAVVGLCEAGACSVTVAARRVASARVLVDELGPHCSAASLCSSDFAAGLAAALAECTLLIQATSATLGAHAGDFAAALPLEALPAGAAVCDLVYQPLETTVLARARAMGLHCVDGLGMLLHQGALAFERWTSVAPPIEVMRKALLSP